MATEVIENNVVYTLNQNNNTASITRSNLASPGSGILSLLNTVVVGQISYTVISINENAFSGYTGLTGSLTIPNSVTSIGNNAFNSCSGFTDSLTIPNSVTSIGTGAFNSCFGFTGTLTIPNSVTSIGDSAFGFCYGFTGTLTIPNSVTSIGSYAFYNCFGFTGTLTIPNSVTSIGEGAFSLCTGFTGNLIIPSSVTNISAIAFGNTINFTNVIIENQIYCIVQQNSFTNVSTVTGSTISFYLTDSASALTGNWPSISSYYETKNYYSQASCFNKGTKILCLNNNLEEEYISIEKLRTGNIVKTYKHGYRKIELIGRIPVLNNSNEFSSCMYKMVKTETNDLTDDLILTAGHSILVDDLKEYKELNNKMFGGINQIIDDKYLLLVGISNDFAKIEDNKVYTCYHFILESNNDYERFGVWANGILTEIPYKKSFLEQNYILV